MPTALKLTLTLLFMAVLLGLSVIPGRERAGDSIFVWAVAVTPTALQKTMHLMLYAVLAFLWTWALEHLESLYMRLAIALCLTASFGALMEYAQTHIPGRFGTISDVLLNVAGALIGLTAALLVL